MPAVHPASLLPALCAFALAVSGCLPGEPDARAPGRPRHDHPARIELRRLGARPRLTLVSRDGDPSPAFAAVFVTEAGPALTTALATVVEARLRTAGLEPDLRVDRDAFCVRFLVHEASRVPALLAALAAATGRPVVAGSPELVAAGKRLRSLQRNPLDAVELAPIAACTGMLGVAPGEPLPDLTKTLEGARRALDVGHISLAAVGPAAYVTAVSNALPRSGGWPSGTDSAPGDAMPSADVVSAYAAPGLDSRSARVTVAVRVADPEAAASAAERLGAADAPLAARLRTLAEPWRVTQLAGVARVRGGCVSAVLEASQRSAGKPVEASAAQAAAVARRELAAATTGSAARRAPSVSAAGDVGRRILAATDPREAASRAAWWAMVGAGPEGPPRWATVLGVASTTAGLGARFSAELDRMVRGASGVERRLAVERGQGELRLLLASTCGVAEESAIDAGSGALALLGAVEARRRMSDVALEPWITSDGLGILARAAFRDGESAAELARRVADAAGRAFAATTLPPDALVAARADGLEHLERVDGRRGAAFEAFVTALAPDHPSWVEPFGVWTRLAGVSMDSVQQRALSLASGPIRLAVLANADDAQAQVAAEAVDRWLAPSPSLGPRSCQQGAATATRAGRLEVKFPDGGGALAQGLLGVLLPPAPGGNRDLAELTAAALDGPEGLLAAASTAATGSARVMGGARAPTLVVDVRAPEGMLSSAIGEVKAALLRMPSAVTEADLARAAAAVERHAWEARADPRRRLTDLWHGRHPWTARPSLPSWRAFLAASLREAALVVVEARPE